MGCIPWYFDLGGEVGYLTSQCSYLEESLNNYNAHEKYVIENFRLAFIYY